MAIEVTCECGRGFGVTNDSVGQSVKCPECGSWVRVAEELIIVEPEHTTNSDQSLKVETKALASSATQNRQKNIVVMYLGAIAMGGVTLFFGFQELRYSLFAATATATVTHKSQEMRGGGRGGPRPVLVLDYSFRDANGAQRNEQDVVPPDWRVDETVLVEYFPGTIGSSRVKGAKSRGGLLLVTGLIAVFWGVIAWLISVSNAKASEPMEPLVPSAIVDIANDARAESSDVRADRSREHGQQRREPNSPMHSPAVPTELGGPGWHRHESGVPMFAPDSLVSRYAGWMGKPLSVIVDRSAGMIHFQNCYYPKGFWRFKPSPWFSCPIEHLVAKHGMSGRGEYFVIVTRQGRALLTITSGNFDSLRSVLDNVIPGGGQGFTIHHPLVPTIYVLFGFGGLVLGVLRASSDLPSSVMGNGFFVTTGFWLVVAMVAAYLIVKAFCAISKR